MTYALNAEWTKLRSLPSTIRGLMAAMALTLAFTALICASSQTSDGDLVELSLAGVYLGQLALAALAVMAATSEHATGMIRATFTATPCRRNVLAAKAAVIGAIGLGVGLVMSLASFFVGRELLDGPGPSLADGPALRAVLGTGLYLAALSLLSLAIGAIVRQTATAITTVLGLLWVPIIAVSLMPQDVGLQVAKFCPMTAGFAIQRTVERADSVPIAPWAGLGLLWAYAAGAFLVALWLVDRRDV
jgi:ABC-2 type transport system permease protein